MTHHSDDKGSCWDEAPFGPGQSNGLLCELPHGHEGAHRAGDTEWMTRDNTQGEPSDAQVDAATRAWSIQYHAYASPHQAIRAALRAASAVTE